ncbi:MAG: serine hydrolase, partial [Robiginitalea sp.]
MAEYRIQDSVQTLLDTYLEKLTSLNQFNGAVLLKKDGKVLLRKAYNMASDTSGTFYVTTESQFDLRSVAKLFAKVAVRQLEKGGRLAPEDSLGTYVPGFPHGSEITVQHLMEHSSGLPRELNDSIQNTLALSPEEVVALAARESLEFRPGTREQYSNVG